MYISTFTRRAAALSLAVYLSLAGTLLAKDDLTIALTGDITAVDPHYHSLSSNNGLAQAIFDGIVRPDAGSKPIPGLAASWKLIDDNTWEFTLREGVKFHDGTPLTTADVLFTFERAMSIKDSPSGGMSRVLAGKTVQPVDDRVFRIVTEAPAPTLLTDLMYVSVISKKVAENATREDFNSGKAAIGTGPYKFVSWIPGQSITLERNDDYWGNKPDFKSVTIRPIPSDPTRVAALLAGDVDVIEQVPSDDLERLRAEEGIEIFQRAARRVMYVHMDQLREQTPDALSNDGAQIKNPLLDRRIRQAISMGINREALVSNLLNGAGEVARQYAPDGSEGNSKTLKPLPYDVDGAKALLAEAGFPEGFRMKLHGANDRYPKAKELAEALGQMMTRIGIKTEVITMPGTIFFKRGASGGVGGTPEFSMNLQGCCASTGQAIAPLVALMHTPDVTPGMGTANRGRYSNPELDKLIQQGLTEMDDVKRDAVIAQATEMAVGDMAVIPLLFNVNIWATRNGVQWMPRTDDITVASDASMN